MFFVASLRDFLTDRDFELFFAALGTAAAREALRERERDLEPLRFFGALGLAAARVLDLEPFLAALGTAVAREAFRERERDLELLRFFGALGLEAARALERDRDLELFLAALGTAAAREALRERERDLEPLRFFGALGFAAARALDRDLDRDVDARFFLADFGFEPERVLFLLLEDLSLDVERFFLALLERERDLEFAFLFKDFAPCVVLLERDRDLLAAFLGAFVFFIVVPIGWSVVLGCPASKSDAATPSPAATEEVWTVSEATDISWWCYGL